MTLRKYRNLSIKVGFALIVMDCESLTQFFWIKIFGVFVTWLKVEPSKHDSELKEMSELFILRANHVCLGGSPGLGSVDMEVLLPAQQLCAWGQRLHMLVLGTKGGDSELQKGASPCSILLLCSLSSFVCIRLLWSLADSCQLR